jgi:hypothetical protein
MPIRFTPRTVRLAAASVGLATLVSGCATAASSAGPAQSPATKRTAAASSFSSPVSMTVSAPTPASTMATPTPAGLAAGGLRPPAGLPWARVAGSPALALASLDGGAVSLLWMDPSRLQFRYVPGTSVPERSPASAADNTPATWVSRMVAAFNGGFMLKDHVGGYYYLGRTVEPLRAGYAAFVISKTGTMSVGVWGRDLHLTSSVLVVRENLRPLVDHGVAMARPSDGPTAWGIANGNLPRANRSALGQLPNGSLVFAYGANVLASTMAASLVRAGATEAVMLDMNISWPTGFTYSHVGGHLLGSKINYHVVRSPSTYYARFRKDFVAVLTR